MKKERIGTNKNKNTATYCDRIQFLHDAIVAQSFLSLKLILGHDLGAGQSQLVFLRRTVETKYAITTTTKKPTRVGLGNTSVKIFHTRS